MTDRPKGVQREPLQNGDSQRLPHEQDELLQAHEDSALGPFDQEPTRWASSGDAPTDLAFLLRAAREEAPPAALISRVGGRLGVSAAPSSAGISGKSWALLGLAGTLACSLAAWQWSQTSGADQVTSVPSPGPSAAQSGPGSPTAPASDSAPSAADPQPLKGSENSFEDRSKEPVRGKQVVRVEGPIQHADDGPAEVILIRQARSNLPLNPRFTLDLLEQHRSRFPRGKLVQEREVLAVQALGRLGDKRAAEERAASFLQNHPGSAHQSRVEQERSTGGSSVK